MKNSKKAKPTVRVEKDFVEFFASFNRHSVKYCVVGSYAVGLHAIPRYTKDVDVWVEPSADNAARIMRALIDFGFGSLALTVDDFNKPGQIIQLGHEPVRIDVITSIEGCTFEEAWATKETETYGAETIYFLGYDALVKTKAAAGRSQDLADLEKLRKFAKK